MRNVKLAGSQKKDRNIGLKNKFTGIFIFIFCSFCVYVIFESKHFADKDFNYIDGNLWGRKHFEEHSSAYALNNSDFYENNMTRSNVFFSESITSPSFKGSTNMVSLSRCLYLINYFAGIIEHLEGRRFVQISMDWSRDGASFSIINYRALESLLVLYPAAKV